LPLQLAGVQVLANGQPLPLLYVSNTWINFQCPLEPAGTHLTVTVDAEDGTAINAFQSAIPEALPGIYTLNISGSGQGTISIANAPQLAMPVAADLLSRPAHQGEYLTIWANGLGPTTVGAPDLGLPAPFAPLVTPKDSASYTLDMSGSGQGAIFIANTPQLAMPVAADFPSRPAHRGEYITIWANGLGPPTDEAPEPGMPAPLAPLVTTKDSVKIVIGGEELMPSFSGLAPLFVGTSKVNVQVPEDAQLGSAVQVYIQITLSDGTVVKSNQVTIAVDLPPPE
jgi:hypothetical protein